METELAIWECDNELCIQTIYKIPETYTALFEPTEEIFVDDKGKESYLDFIWHLDRWFKRYRSWKR